MNMNMNKYKLNTKVLWTIFLLIFLVACSEKDNQLLTNQCGIVMLNSDDKSFSFFCGLSEESYKKIPELAGADFNEENICDITYSPSGLPERFRCRAHNSDDLEHFIGKGLSTVGDWVCTGLDGYGGYSRAENQATLSLSANEFKLHIKKKQKSDSIWYFDDSVISGKVDSNDKKIVLSPSNWEGELLSFIGKKNEISLNDVPKTMLAKPLSIQINTLTQDRMKGTSRWVDNPNEIVSYVDCFKKPV